MVTVHTGSRPRPLLEPSLKEPSSQLVVVAAAVEPVVNTARSARSPAPSPSPTSGLPRRQCANLQLEIEGSRHRQAGQHSGAGVGRATEASIL